MSQVGQVLCDYTRWFQEHGAEYATSEAVDPVREFLKDYDQGEWLPNTDGEGASQEFVAVIAQGMTKWLHDEGFQVPGHETVQRLLGEAFANMMTELQDAPHEEIDVTESIRAKIISDTWNPSVAPDAGQA